MKKKEEYIMAGYAPDNSTLAMTGATGIMGMSFEQFSMVGMGLLTVGAAMTAAKFAPRVAIEPRYDLAKGKQRMVLTLNGHPVRRRNTKL